MAAARPKTDRFGHKSAPAAPLTPSNIVRSGAVCAAARDGDPASVALPQQQRAARLSRILKVDLSGCKYELFRHVASRLSWQLVPAGSTDWDLCWLDTSVSQERLLRLEPTQRVNHFYGMLELARKRPMARTVGTLATAAAAAVAADADSTLCSSTTGLAAAALSSGPEASLLLDFMPQTWLLPQQLPAFLSAAQATGRKATYIVKPDAGCQGRGIRLVMGGPEPHVLQSLGGAAAVEATPAVAQQYIANPLLVNGLKFDLRVYCLITSVEPLRVFLYKEGLVRFCTTPYKRPTSKNLACSYMHLTNYAVNKLNTAAFVNPTGTAAPGSSSPWRSPSMFPGRGSSSDGSDGIWVQEGCTGDASKWSFQQLRQYLELQGANWPLLWSRISQLVTKSLIAVTPHLAASYKMTVLNTPNIPTTVPSKHSSCTTLQAAGTITSPAASSSSRHVMGPQRHSSSSSRHVMGPQRRSSSSSDGAAGAGGGLTGRGRKQKGLSPAAVAAACGCRCFELLGFDVLIDAEFKPWLVEVNHSPSFNIDSPLDRAIKEALVVDTVRLVRLDPKSIAAAKLAAHKATQARLLTSTQCRQGCVAGSNACSLSSDGCSVAVQLEAQQAERAALVASIDAWQTKHLGGFERAYPLVTLGTPAGPSSTSSSSNSSSLSRPNLSRGNSRDGQLTQQEQQQQQQQWLQYAAKQQELYDQLLTLSGSVYRQQQQQQQAQRSPLKQRLQPSPGKQRQHQQLIDKQQQHQAPGLGLRKCTSQAAHASQQRCLQKCPTSPSRLPHQQQQHGYAAQQVPAFTCSSNTHSSSSSSSDGSNSQPVTAPHSTKHDLTPAAALAVAAASVASSTQSGAAPPAPACQHRSPATAAGDSDRHSGAAAGDAAAASTISPATGAAPNVLCAQSAGSRMPSAHKADSALAALRAVLAATEDWAGQVGAGSSSSSSNAGSADSSRQALHSSRPDSSSGSHAAGRSGQALRPDSSSGTRGCSSSQTLWAQQPQTQSAHSTDACSCSSHCICASGMSSGQSSSSSSGRAAGRSGSCSRPSSSGAASSSARTARSQCSMDTHNESTMNTSCNAVSHMSSSAGSSSSSRSVAGSSRKEGYCVKLHEACQPPAHVIVAAKAASRQSASLQLGRQLQHSSTWPRSPAQHNSGTSVGGPGCSSEHSLMVVASGSGSRPTVAVERPGSLAYGRGQLVVAAEGSLWSSQQLQLVGAAVSRQQKQQHGALAGLHQEPSQGAVPDDGSGSSSQGQQGQFLPQLGCSARLLQRVNTTGGLLGQLDLRRVLGADIQAAAASNRMAYGS